MSLLSLLPKTAPWEIMPRNFPDPEEEKIMSSNILASSQLALTWFKMMAMTTIMIYQWVARSRVLISSAGRGRFVMFLGKTLYSHSASLHPCVQMGTGEFNAGVLLYNGIASHRGGRGVEILLATSSSWLLHPGVLATWLICKLSLYLTEWVTPAHAKMKPDLKTKTFTCARVICVVMT